MQSIRSFLLVALTTVYAFAPETVFATDSFPKSGAVKKAETDATSPDTKVPKPQIVSVEVFGSNTVNEKKLRELLGPELQQWFELGLNADPKATELEKKLADKVKNKYGFALAEWSIVQYIEPSRIAMHVTLDVVPKEEREKRMPFLPTPTREFADPSGLIRGWLEYEGIALKLADDGKLNPKPGGCVALHCPFGHDDEQLKPFEKMFVEGVAKHSSELLQIASEDKRTDYRAAAVYLLPYWKKDGKKVVDAMVKRIRDPEPLVRNNALRVLGDIAEFHPDLVIPRKPVLEALNFPRVSDRSKALYLTYVATVHSAEWKEDLIKGAVPTLLTLMASQQPDHREISHGVLKKISGKDFAATDLKSWNKWASTLKAERDVAKK